MNALKTSLRTLSCIAALGALVAAAPLALTHNPLGRATMR